MKFSLFNIVASIFAVQVTAEAQDDCRPTNHPAVFNCGSSSDYVNVASVKLSPPKPVKGENLLLTITGQLKNTLTGDARIHYVATSNGQVVKTVDSSLCEFLGAHNVNIHCPVEPKDLEFGAVLAIPGNLPTGTYVVHAVAQQGSDQVFNFKVVAPIQ